MRKIKLVLSDVHIGSGRRLPDGTPNVLEDFHYDNKFVEFLQYYSSDKYNKYEIELIINGDFFNFLQIDYEGQYHSIITESLSVYQMRRIIEGWVTVFDALAEFNSSKNKKIIFVTGNHDPQLLWEGVRSLLRERIGGELEFKNITYRFDGFHIEHGQQYETWNKFDLNKFFLFEKSPEPILNIPWATRFCIEVLTRFKKVNPLSDKIKPFSSFLGWALIHETRFFFYVILKSFLYICKSMVWPSKYFKMGSWQFFKILSNIKLYGRLDNAARTILKDDKIHTVIFGHAHHAKYLQFGHDKEYINTGTWTEITSLNLSDLGTKVYLTYAIIKYPKGIGRPRAKLKRWRGSWKITEDVY